MNQLSCCVWIGLFSSNIVGLNSWIRILIPKIAQDLPSEGQHKPALGASLRKMRFLLYNIRYATAKNRPRLPWSGYLSPTGHHLGFIIEFIRDVNPDIAGLIEVDGGSFRTRDRHQAEIIAEQLGHYHSYESKYCDSTRVASFPVMKKQGNAFLAKDSICNERFHYFSNGVKRLVIECEMEGVTIFLVHLALGYKTRQSQLAELYQLIQGIERPYIVAGDFNALWGEREIELFLGATGLLDANIDSLPSFPSWNPKRHLDFILHSPEIKIDEFSMPQVELSDHLPMVIDFHVGS